MASPRAVASAYLAGLQKRVFWGRTSYITRNSPWGISEAAAWACVLHRASTKITCMEIEVNPSALGFLGEGGAFLVK